MASKWFEQSTVFDLRQEVARLLGLSQRHGRKQGAPSDFWEDAEEKGMLVQAVELYDRLEAERARRPRRETKKEFEERVEKEGRAAEAQRLRDELLASGLNKREVQRRLVGRLQPLDGSATVAWETPNSWAKGRLFRTKAQHEELLALVEADNDADADFEEDEFEYDGQEAKEAAHRLACARWRQEEREALAEARRRAHALKAAAVG
jgi:hypothetical protein